MARCKYIFRLLMLIVLVSFGSSVTTICANNEHDTSSLSDDDRTPSPQQRIINTIVVTGNKSTPTQAILNHIPYQRGEIFDPTKTSVLIRNLYTKLKRFRNIIVKGQLVEPGGINLYVEVEEKPLLQDVIFKNNKVISRNEIFKKIDFDIPAIDPEELNVLAEQVKRIYLEKGYLSPEIETEVEFDDEGRATAIFTFTEGIKSVIKRIKFRGNTHATDKELRDVMFTKEDWILSFLDKSGTYIPDRIQGDKMMIEKFYQNRGYLQAKVTDVELEKLPKGFINITFEVEEGDQYHFGKISAPGNDLFTDEQLVAMIAIRPGMLYSRDAIEQTMKALEQLWGNYGYVFASVEPSVQPNEEDKTVDITFFSELGNKILINKINLKGNTKTRDKVIRRRLLLQEGAPLTSPQMEASKQNVQSLGYFKQQDGTNIKIRRLGPEYADVDVIVKEEKTGHANVELSYGGAGFDIRSPNSGFSVKASVADTNLVGSGINVMLEGSWARDQQTLNFHVGQPWLFDRPISAALDIYHRRPSYDELRNIQAGGGSVIHEKLTGGVFAVGAILPPSWKIMHDVQLLASVGADSLRYQDRPTANVNSVILQEFGFGRDLTLALNQSYQDILNCEFNPGDYAWVAVTAERDKRNHPLHVSRGHRFKFLTRVAIPSITGNIGFTKITIENQWFTPLIGDYDLVFRLRTFLGFILPMSRHTVPYGELFHVGGASSVRGFNYGQIGTAFLTDSIGSDKAFFMNAELVFPITPDFNIKGVLFYDGGAGWGNPYVGPTTIGVRNNNFDYRHAIGFGVRLLRPMPIRVDWGFKIDPRTGESPSEVHFGTSFDW